MGVSRAESPSGRILYFKTERAVALREPDGRETVVRTAPAELRGAALVPDSSGVVLGDGRGIRSISFGTSKLGWLGARGGPSEQLGFSDDGRWLVASGNRIVVLDTTTGDVRHELARADSADARSAPTSLPTSESRIRSTARAH